MLSSTLGNLLSGLSDENEAFYLAVKAVDPLVIFALLVITAADENRRFAHGFDALNSGIGIGSLGIVVIIHTALGGHELNSMLHCVETADHCKDRLHGYLHALCDGNGCHNIFHIAQSYQIHIFMNIHQLVLFAVYALDDLVIPQEITVLQLVMGGEQDRSGRTSVGEISGIIIVIIQHTDICLRLMGGHCFLSRHIGFHGVMSVQVIRCDVQDCGYHRMECMYGL